MDSLVRSIICKCSTVAVSEHSTVVDAPLSMEALKHVVLEASALASALRTLTGFCSPLVFEQRPPMLLLCSSDIQHGPTA
mmetsp:Transcript_33331/g.61113  ORF Transcript_33331/g.61113 Transcript_33331/m.61113 type:complete len:80 (+) Transcript_33331:626-865(+)